MKNWFVVLMLFSLIFFTGCNTNNISGEKNGNTENDEFSKSEDELFTERDMNSEYDKANAVSIALSETTVSSTSNTVDINGSVVTITEEATYVISGVLTNGMIIVDANENDKLHLVLSGVNITSMTSACIYILEADKVVITLAEGTENRLSNGGTFTAIDENNIDSVIFSKQDLTINGTGALLIDSPAGHGIVSKDDLVFTGGDYEINSSSHGIDANDSIRIKDSTFNITAGKDGLHAENSDDTSLGYVYISSGSINATTKNDGISSTAYMQIEGGNFNINTSGGSSSDSMKGMKAAGSMLINEGSFSITSTDDSVHSDASITVNGGSFDISTGDDGFHANETLKITGGKINITKSYEGLEALDIEISNGEITLTASDDGINAAGGTDSSGFGGNTGNDMFGRPGGRPGGGIGGSSSDGSIVISGGAVSITASGDGIDANGTLLISGGFTTVCGPTQGDTATLDYDVSGTITGGTFIGTGALGMAQSFSDSEQGVFAVSVGSRTAGTQITVYDENDNIILTHTPSLSFAVVIISTPEMKKGETYKITVGEDVGSFSAS